MPKDACPKCGQPKDRRARHCFTCRESNQRKGPRPEMRGPRSTAADVVERALRSAEEVDGCLIVTEWRPQPKGYVRVAPVDERAGQLVHRLVMEVRLGRRLAEGETVDHTCHNGSGCTGGPTCVHRRCINADHLEVVDAVTNWERGTQGAIRLHREKTHCPHGHPYEPANLRTSKQGYRQCKACHRARSAGRPLADEPTYL